MDKTARETLGRALQWRLEKKAYGYGDALKELGHGQMMETGRGVLGAGEDLVGIGGGLGSGAYQVTNSLDPAQRYAQLRSATKGARIGGTIGTVGGGLGGAAAGAGGAYLLGSKLDLPTWAKLLAMGAAGGAAGIGGAVAGGLGGSIVGSGIGAMSNDPMIKARQRLRAVRAKMQGR